MSVGFTKLICILSPHSLLRVTFGAVVPLGCPSCRQGAFWVLLSFHRPIQLPADCTSVARSLWELVPWPASASVLNLSVWECACGDSDPQDSGGGRDLREGEGMRVPPNQDLPYLETNPPCHCTSSSSSQSSEMPDECINKELFPGLTGRESWWCQ